ncbi:MAG: CRISPR-associated protein Csx15 [Anaerolineae bacterium]|nr:CRISPR-associated protein Csx15 [Anaerolineae bacterium]
MIILNFSHPLTSDQVRQLESLTGQEADQVVDIPTHLDTGRPFGPQIVELADRAGLSPAQWQTLPILVVPPALNFAAVLLLAELHGRMGYFPPCVRLRPVEGALPPRYEVAEVLDLQGQRDGARARR